MFSVWVHVIFPRRLHLARLDSNITRVLENWNTYVRILLQNADNDLKCLLSRYSRNMGRATHEPHIRRRSKNTFLHFTHMNTTQRLLDLSPRTVLRLSEVERLIRIHRIVIPPLASRTLQKMCEDGTLETAPRLGRRWLVYEDSFLDWVKSLDES